VKTVIYALVLAVLAAIAGLLCYASGGLTKGDVPNVPGVVALLVMYLFGAIAGILVFAAIALRLFDYFHERSDDARSSRNRE
jgi:hypothetical protein